VSIDSTSADGWYPGYRGLDVGGSGAGRKWNVKTQFSLQKR